MRKLMSSLIFLLFFIPGKISAQVPVLVKVEVKTQQPLPSNEALFIRGDHIFLGNWKYESVRLKRRDQNTWGGIFIMNPGENMTFVIDQGSASSIMSDTIRHTVDTATTLTVNCANNQDINHHRKGKIHQVPGTVKGQLIQRIVRVRTPIDYDLDTTKNYPVVYFQDGQYVMGNDKGNTRHWGLLKVLDSLENSGSITPFISVFIDHEFSNRSMEYSDTDLGERYRHYLCSELPPQIERLFQCSENNQDHYIAGAVAGGFIASHAAMTCPDEYKHVIALSPAYLIHENDFPATMDSIWHNEVDFYFDSGEFGMDEELKVGCDSLAVLFKEKDIDFKYELTLNTIPDGENFGKRIIQGLVHYFSPKS